MKKSHRLVLNDHQSILDEIFDTLNEMTTHQQCTDHLLTEVYKFLNGYSLDVINGTKYSRSKICGRQPKQTIPLQIL